ncbi:hypothetical protein DMENIID0001_041930 [Sergentomyia squamirostris]
MYSTQLYNNYNLKIWICFKVADRVLIIITDNNRVNQAMFVKFCGDNLLFPNPCPLYPDDKIFFMYDPVYIFCKNVKNNWMNEVDNVFEYPDFLGAKNKLQVTKYRSIENQYESEKNITTQQATKLAES